jgi:hypothetical protein
VTLRDSRTVSQKSQAGATAGVLACINTRSQQLPCGHQGLVIVGWVPTAGLLVALFCDASGLLNQDNRLFAIGLAEQNNVSGKADGFSTRVLVMRHSTKPLARRHWWAPPR